MANTHMSSAAAALAGVAPAAPASAGKATATPDETLFGELVETPRPDAPAGEVGAEPVANPNSADNGERAVEPETAASPIATTEPPAATAKPLEQPTSASASPETLEEYAAAAPTPDALTNSLAARPLTGADASPQEPATPAPEANERPRPTATTPLPSFDPSAAKAAPVDAPTARPAPEAMSHGAPVRPAPVRETGEPRADAPTPRPTVSATPESAPTVSEAGSGARDGGTALSNNGAAVDATETDPEAPVRERTAPLATPEARDAAPPTASEQGRTPALRDAANAPAHAAPERREAPQQAHAVQPMERAPTDGASISQNPAQDGGDASGNHAERGADEIIPTDKPERAAAASYATTPQSDLPASTTSKPAARPDAAAGNGPETTDQAHRQDAARPDLARPQAARPDVAGRPDAITRPDAAAPRNSGVADTASRPAAAPEAPSQTQTPDQSPAAEQAPERPDRYAAANARPQPDGQPAMQTRTEGAADVAHAAQSQPATEASVQAVDLSKPDAVERPSNARPALVTPAPVEATPALDPAALAADPLERPESALDRAGQPAKLAAHRFHTAMAHQTPTGQVAFSIAQSAADAAERIRVQMFPRELGEVEVLMDVQEDRRAEVVVRAERAETMELLQKDARELQRVLQAAGLNVADDDLSFELGGHGADGDGDGKSGGDADHADAGDSADDRHAVHANRWRAVTPGGVDLVA